MKKAFKVLRDLGIYSLVGFLFGFLFFFIKDHMNMLECFDKLPFYINGLIFIFTYILTISLHEFGHALGFIRYGLKMRAVFFTIFVLIKEDNKWSFKLTSMKNLGGIAIPDIVWIEDEEDFKEKQRALAKAIIMGPITSVMVWLILTLASLLIISLTSNIYVKSALLIFIVFLGIDTLLIIGASFLKQESAIGDFPAYTIIKNDRFFCGSQLYSYGYLSSQPERARIQNTYLREFILKELEKKYEAGDSHWFTLNTIDTLIVEYLGGFLDKLPLVVENYVNFIIASPDILEKIQSSVTLDVLYFHIIILLYRDEESREKALDLYRKLKDTMQVNTPKREYLFKQLEQALGVNDHRQYLRDRKNIITSDVHHIYKYFYGYYMDEIRINESL